MGVDDIVVEIHRGEKFVDGDKVEYVGGGVFKIEPVDIVTLSRFKIIGLAKDIGFTNAKEFYYLILGMSLREGLRTCHNDFESLYIAAAAVHKRLIGGVPKEVVPKMPALPYPSMATQQSNVDLMSNNINNGQECDQKGGLDGSTSTFGSQNSRGTRFGKTKHPHQPQPQPQHLLLPLFHPLPAHSHDTTPVFNVNNEHVPEWDWEDPRPKSPIPWDKLIEGESLNKESGNSEYVPEIEVAFQKQEAKKKKINVGGGVDDDGCENDGDEHDWDTDIQDEWEADVEDLETSGEEWAAARATVGECKKQKGSGSIDNAKQVGKQDMTVDKSTTGGIEQTQLGSSFHSNYETSKAEMDFDGETDGDVPRLLRK
ncbi:hypothetical protein Cgig2_032888 [Carnegiea gigantea]|uniref:PB1-like domain-containing protein n=1 Tax=Carnegiea gigantea TaxID=171969 RepID=A0A9Q1JX28_9CARY|nr:hypothetical protein Cgig2_032888 [Carnegiea gigantea]